MIQIKPATLADVAEIHALWHKGFGDEAEFVDSFYRRCCKLEHTFLLREDGVLRTMAAAPLVTLCLPDGSRADGAYIYALTTDPQARGKGFGQMLLRYADFYLQEHKLDCVVLVPAEPSLFQFFRTAGYDSAFSLSKIEVPADQVAAPLAQTGLRPAQAEEYNQAREAHLAGTFHVAYGHAMIDFQKSMSQSAQSELYLLDLPHGTGCAAVERWTGGVGGDGIMIKELLTPEGDLAQGLALVARQEPAPRYFVRYPIFDEGLAGDYGQPFGMIKWYSAEKAVRWGGEKRGYLGLAFD